MNPPENAPPFYLKLVVFLGNPGDGYRNTRHNFAWRVPEFLDPPPHDWKKRFQGEISRYSFSGGSTWLLKPMTLMNLSGRSISRMAGYLAISPNEILVVHDDLELDFGRIALKRGGGLGGHNGLRSITDSLGTRDFLRLRLGISRPGRGSVTSWVLGRFSKEEARKVDGIAAAAALEIKRLLLEGERG
ncbi:MAG TPA: aminoacyl-tRNA hydrolase [Candidatus Aminicenantes bacterium]|nr:aminoacyl-tRNA hydrolase [Candidatus Aminicenantes bacterium]